MKNTANLKDDYQTFEEAGFVELTEKVMKNYNGKKLPITAQQLAQIDKEIIDDMQKDCGDEF